MQFSTVFQSVMVMGCMIGIGVLLKRVINFNEEARKLLMAILINVAIPSIILASIFNFPMDDEIFRLLIIIFLLSIMLNLLGIFSGWLAASLMKVPAQKANEMAIVSGLGNTAFIGIPLCAALFGPKGALLAALFDAGLDFTIWTVAVLLLQKEKQFSLRTLKELLNLPILAVIVGLILGYFQFQPPTILLTLTTNLANLASPLAMIYIGLLIPTLWQERTSISKRQLSVPILIKLLLFPFITVLILRWLPLEMEIIEVVLVQATMPTITLASILFDRYEADVKFGAAATVFSTMISLLTIPVMVYLGSQML